MDCLDFAQGHTNPLLDWLKENEYMYQYDVYGHQVWKSEKMVSVIHEKKGLKLIFKNEKIPEKILKDMIIRFLVKQEEGY